MVDSNLSNPPVFKSRGCTDETLGPGFIPVSRALLKNQH